MEDYKAKQRIRKRIYSPLVFILLFIVTILLVKGAGGVFIKQRESRENLQRVQAELNLAKNREAELEASVKYLKTQEGIEEEIRDKYSVAKPGEELVLIVEPKGTNDATYENDTSWWGKVSSWFGNIFD